MSDLIKRIDDSLEYADEKSWTLATLLRDCRSEIERLNANLERERMRLAACGVVALANTKESAERCRQMHDDYKSDSLNYVIKMVDSEMSLRAEIERLKVNNSELERAIKMQGGVQAQLCEHQIFLEAEIAKRKYVPMTDDELWKFLLADKTADAVLQLKHIEAHIIKRAGLEYVQKSVQESEGGNSRPAEGQK